MNEDRCVCCGKYVPEGTMICRECELKSHAYEQVQFERDMAMMQLGKYGIDPFEKIRPETIIRSLICSVKTFISEKRQRND